MTVYDMYNEMLENDSNCEKYKELLSSAESKIVGTCEGGLTAFELCALIDGMSCFESWPVFPDFWDPDSWEDAEAEDEELEDEELEDEDPLLERMKYDSWDIRTEYVTRKLCCLIDTMAPREEIEEWFIQYDCETYDYIRFGSLQGHDTEKKFFDWYESQTLTPDAFADSLSSQDIISLLKFASLELPNHDLPREETDSDYPNWSKYQIVSQYIRTRLCYCLDQKDSWEDIEKWYQLNYAFNYTT